MERSVAAAAGEGVDIACDVAVAVPIGSACWVVRLLLLYRPTSDCFLELVWLAMLSTQPPSLAGGEAAASSCRRGQSVVAHVRGLIPVRIGC